VIRRATHFVLGNGKCVRIRSVGVDDVSQCQFHVRDTRLVLDHVMVKALK
jgi:hypothetical protein